MSRANTFQVALSVDAANALRRCAVVAGIPPSTYARMLLNTALRVEAPPPTPQPKKAKR